MKKNEFLQDAIGLIGDDLILDAKAVRVQKKKKQTWVKWGAMAASILLLVTCVFAFLQIGSDPNLDLPVAKNLWQQENFQAYSLAYTEQTTARNMALFNPATAQTLSLSAKQPQDGAIASTALSISQPNTIKLESLIAERYAIYYSEDNVPIVYDIEEGRKVNLEERIIGENRLDVESFVNRVLEIAEEKYPDMMASPENREVLREDVYRLMDVIRQAEKTPDLDFFDNYEEYKDLSWERKLSVFYEFCYDAIGEALDEEMGSDFVSDPLAVQMIAFDAINGVCLVRVRDIVGNGLDYLVYDIATDICWEIPKDEQNTLLGTMLSSGYQFRFSTDGNIVTVAYPDAYVSGEHVSYDPTKPLIGESLHREVESYNGENIGVFYLNVGKAYRLDVEDCKGASEAYVSDSGEIVYYKQMKPEAMGKTFYCSDEVWFNRLQLFADDTDSWVFCNVDRHFKTVEKKTVLQGNFVRLIANETIAIMERGGKYFAYALEDGRDITEEVKAGKVTMLAHERLLVSYKDGRLYKKDMFAGLWGTSIAKADNYVLSNDGAFAFVYNDGDDYVTCINVASLESTRISISEALCEQIFNTENAVFRIIYNEAENTVLFSFYVEENGVANEKETVDFFGAVEAYDPDGAYGKVYTNLKVSDSIAEQFSRSASMWQGGGDMTPGFYPCSLTVEDNIDIVCQKLGITPPTGDYLDVNGTQFILYQDEDETLSLIFKKGWVLYDFPEEDAGFMIEYIQNGEVHRYHF